MALHIGIVACSAEGAALCYRTICAEGARLLGAHRHPEVSLHSLPLADYVAALDRGDLEAVARLMLGSADKLAAIGADLLICPDNTVHQAMALVAPRSPRPWLHIAEVVAAEASRRGLRRLGLVGTRWLVQSAVYPDALAAHGLACMLPGPAAIAEVDRIIMDELVPALPAPGAVAAFRSIFQQMKENGCDAVILGCTEIPLVMNDANSPLPTLDSTRLLALAALQRAIGGA
jgi:aspartate racemase